MTPKRIQRPYVWPAPRLAVNAGRPTKFGNPYRTGNAAADVEYYRRWLYNPDAQPIRLGRRVYRPLTEADRQEIRGHDVACFCPLGAPCHGEVLVEWANSCPTN